MKRVRSLIKVVFRNEFLIINIKIKRRIIL